MTLDWILRRTQQLTFGAFEDGQAFVAGVLAKIADPEKRAQAEAILKDPAAKDAVTLLGDGVLARADYSKSMDGLKKQTDDAKAKLDEATTLYERNATWYEQNKAALTEYPSLKAQLAKRGTGGEGDDDEEAERRRRENPPPDPRKIAEEVVNESGRSYIEVSAWMAGKVAYHSHMFGEPFDPTELLANPKLGKPIAGQPGRVYSLNDAYQEKFGERLAAKEKATHDKLIEDEVQKRLGEERSKLANQPFPLRGGAEPSVLDVLADKNGSAAHTVDTAVAEYDRLSTARGT